MSKKVLITVVAVAAIAGAAYYYYNNKDMTSIASDETMTVSCTMEEYTNKAQTVQTKVIELQQTNPQAFQDAMMKMQDIGQKMAANPNDFGAACQALDEILDTLK